MKSLDELRKQIDEIDEKIVDLFERRMDCAEEVGRYKLKNGIPVLDSGREDQLLEKRLELVKDKRLDGDVSRLFRLLMSMSRARQTEIMREGAVVAYQGEAGANSEAALFNYFGKTAKAQSYRNFKDVFAAVVEGKASYGVLPIENSSTGGVYDVYDLLLTHEVYVCGEVKLKIEHCLLGTEDANIKDIKEVYSHEQALKQCSRYLEKLGAKLYPDHNTAISAKYVSELGDSSRAAVAGRHAADIYGLKILAEDINESSDNTTRFIIISALPYEGGDADKASVCFSLEHRSGALAAVLNLFAGSGLNMVKIESRPLKSRNFEYSFYIDFEGEGIERIKELLQRNFTLFSGYRFLGAYRRAKA